MGDLPLRLANLDLTSVSGGRFSGDGGTMFGAVPKLLWQRKCPPDDRNRVLMDTNCLLVRAGNHTILIDTGYGSKANDRQRLHRSLEDGNPLLRNLAAAGISPDEITLVILTHLHFDHAGGCTLRDDAGRLRPTFPRAKHLVQRTEWQDATANLPELAGSYFTDDFLPLEDARLVELLDGHSEILPGISVRLTGGHTRGHQIIDLGTGPTNVPARENLAAVPTNVSESLRKLPLPFGERVGVRGQAEAPVPSFGLSDSLSEPEAARPAPTRALYLADLCPFTAHMKTFWQMSYDQFPLDVRRTKPLILAEAADHGYLVLFDHDPLVKAALLRRDPKDEFALAEVLPL